MNASQCLLGAYQELTKASSELTIGSVIELARQDEDLEWVFSTPQIFTIHLAPDVFRK